MGRKDVRSEPKLNWDDFAGKPANEVLPKIYSHVDDFSNSLRAWYWAAIKGRRGMSSAARMTSYVLAVAGVAGPLAAAISGDTETRLLFTQAGVISLAVAGLVQLCDKVFGWSSGWLRYVTTVTVMERITRQFHLDWAGTLVDQPADSLESVKKPLFDLARQFVAELLKRQGDETDGWVSEFAAGMAALNDMIKAQTEATAKAAADALAATESKTRANQTGVLEVSFVRAGLPEAMRLVLDDGEPITFLGIAWVSAGLKPGLHVLKLQMTGKDGKPEGSEIQRAIEVQPGAIARVEIDLRPILPAPAKSPAPATATES